MCGAGCCVLSFRMVICTARALGAKVYLSPEALSDASPRACLMLLTALMACDFQGSRHTPHPPDPQPEHPNSYHPHGHTHATTPPTGHQQPLAAHYPEPQPRKLLQHK